MTVWFSLFCTVASAASPAETKPLTVGHFATHPIYSCANLRGKIGLTLLLLLGRWRPWTCFAVTELRSFAVLSGVSIWWWAKFWANLPEASLMRLLHWLGLESYFSPSYLELPFLNLGRHNLLSQSTAAKTASAGWTGRATLLVDSKFRLPKLIRCNFSIIILA